MPVRRDNSRRESFGEDIGVRRVQEDIPVPASECPRNARSLGRSRLRHQTEAESGETQGCEAETAKDSIVRGHWSSKGEDSLCTSGNEGSIPSQ